MIEIYDGSSDLVIMEDGQTYTSAQLAESPKYQGIAKYKTVLWKADDSGQVFRWRYFNSVIGLLSDDEMQQYQDGSLNDAQALEIINERFDYVSPTNDELSDAVIEVSTITDQNTSDIADIMDAIIEMTNIPQA